jgi:hypothetical protein
VPQGGEGSSVSSFAVPAVTFCAANRSPAFGHLFVHILLVLLLALLAVKLGKCLPLARTRRPFHSNKLFSSLSGFQSSTAHQARFCRRLLRIREQHEFTTWDMNRSVRSNSGFAAFSGPRHRRSALLG